VREIRVKVPEGKNGEIARIALRAGIDEVAVTQLYLHGPNRSADLISVEVSTPKAKAFVDALRAHENLDPGTWSISSREVRAISAAVVLAYGMMENSPSSIIVAALFLPILSEVLALSFGLWTQALRLSSAFPIHPSPSSACGRWQSIWRQLQ
jgi:hypothetical protein